MDYCAVNGEPTPSIAINDRALAYGDGMFTTAKVVNGQVEYFNAHLERLKQGCAYLGINVDHELLINEINQAVVGMNLAVLKVIVSAGNGGRGYSRLGVGQSQRIVMIHPFPEHYFHWAENGIAVESSPLRLGLNPLLKGLKHLNRLEQVLIRADLDKRQCEDVIVADINDHIIESSCANVFWLKDDVIYTPELSNAGVLGIYRQQLMALDSDIQTVSCKLNALPAIDAMFICNSVMGIVPVHRYNETLLDITPVIAYRERFLTSTNRNMSLG